MKCQLTGTKRMPACPAAANDFVVRAAIARGEVQHTAWAAERPDGGRGFGLALTRLVCRRRGGDVTVQNADGAVFTATLPTAVRGELEEVQA